MPKISVIVPVYKAEAYLPGCIESILSQTFSDFELFLVNDGSPDSCGTICEEYAAKDSRIRVIHQANQGQAAARNHALAKATGAWVCFVDSDDLIHPQQLELLLDAAIRADAGISMCAMLEAPELPADFAAPCNAAFETLAMDEAAMVTLYDADDYPAWVACGKLIRRELIDQHLFCPGRVYEDNEAVCHWVCRAQRLARTSHKLYFYRTNPTSTTQSSFSPKRLDYLWALENIIRFYSSIGWLRMKERFVARYADAAANFCYEARISCPDAVKQIERSVREFARQEKLDFSARQKEVMLQAMRPELIGLYWPVAGAVRTLREQGISGLTRKIAGHLRKGEEK